MKLHSCIYDIASVSADDRDRMFELMQQSYENKRRHLFDADIDAKQWAIVVRRPADNRIVGFSTQVLLRCRVGGEIATALYSGDTVVDRAEWGDPALAHAWGNFALRLIDEHSMENGPLYWLLTSKGFRTYHYLPLFFRRYFPQDRVSTPTDVKTIIDAFGQCIGNDRYDSHRGIILADDRSDFVRPEVADAGPLRNNNVHFRTFSKLNPGYTTGDELCCLAPLSHENFTRAAHRVIGLARVVHPAV